MNDANRARLAKLKALGNRDVSMDSTIHELCKWAADEIEHLNEAVRFWQKLSEEGRVYIERAEKGQLGSPLSRGIEP